MERQTLEPGQFRRAIELQKRIISKSVSGDLTVIRQVDIELLDNCKIGKLTFINAAFTQPHVEFRNCEIDELIIMNFGMTSFRITGGNFGKIIIASDDKPTVAQSIQIHDVQSPDLELEINNILINSAIKISGSSLAIISASLLKCNSITFNDVTVGRELLLSDTDSQHGTVNFTDVSGVVRVFSLKTEPLLIFKDCILPSLDIKNSVLTKLELNIQKIDTLYVENLSTAGLELKSGHYGNLSFKLLKVKSFFSIEGTHNDSINIEQLTVHGNQSSIQRFAIRYANISSVTLENCYNTETYIDDCDIRTKFSIERCSLGNAKFRNIDLQDCKTVSFFDTNLIGPEFFNFRWHASYELDERLELTNRGDKLSLINHYWKLRESYRQLKIVSVSNHNSIDAHFFQRGELDVYYKILVLKKRKRKHWNDLIILWVSRTFGGYGQSLWIPLVYWMIFHAVLFTLILHLGKFPFRYFATSWDSFDWNSTKRAAGLFINLLSPVHNSEYYGIKITGITDAIMRFVSGLFIYYIIRASRKFIS